MNKLLSSWVKTMRRIMLYLYADGVVDKEWTCEYITPDAVFDPIIVSLQKKVRTTQKSNYKPTELISINLQVLPLLSLVILEYERNLRVTSKSVDIDYKKY